MDALLLSRIQFGFVISFHILFPAFTIGLASWLAYLEFRWLRALRGADGGAVPWRELLAKDAAPAINAEAAVWRDLYFFWVKIFAVSFGMGVVSGIVMSFQFGTNWSVLSERAGNILGPLLSYEVLTAFFLEASFLGVMLFGAKRVSPALHFFATCMVALGTLISTFWIIAASSWMHTPAGYTLVDGVFSPASWWQIVFNPSFPYRRSHMVLAAFITTCFVIGGVSARYLLRGEHTDAAQRMLKLAVLFAAITVPAQILVGDMHGHNVREYQPIKLAAIEAHWRNEGEGRGVPLVLFAVPDEKAERNEYEIAIPRLGSLLLTWSLDGEIAPLTSVPPEDRPPVAPVFYAFRVMVGLGLLMLALALLSVWKWRRGRLFESRMLLRAWYWMLPSGFIALLSGWYVVEIGRQPWVVYGLLRTADAVSAVDARSVLASLITFAVVYAVVFGSGIAYLATLVRKGPQPHEPVPDTDGGDKTPARPLSAPDEPLEGVQ